MNAVALRRPIQPLPYWSFRKVVVVLASRDPGTALSGFNDDSLAGITPGAAVKYYVYGDCKRLGTMYLGPMENESLIHAQAVATSIATATATNLTWLVKARL